ncbi:LTA synthase family protein [Acidaminobacter sp. JC074]|uniref:LTA synthase family protein n=1 Tax=Acidaminobacter sp. JC074 TaxID=2530199 RepID=UPI001F0DCA6D|nr:LTA synthase family protein [Acidaminobacter sp. JC074]MCH4886415.1 LTA synthase family protein [Acidaminobacter sp. JC074]
MFNVFIVAIIITLYVEVIYRSSCLDWILRHPVKVLSNIMIYTGLIGLLNQHLSLSLSVILVVSIGLSLGYGNKYKYMFRGDNLYPWDLKLGKESSNMKSFLGLKSILLDVSLAAMILGLSMFMVKSTSLSDNQAMILMLIHFILIEISLLGHKDLPVKNQTDFYARNGLALAFLMNVKEWATCSPSIKKESYVKNCSSDVKSLDQTNKPNVVFIMNESFWDPSSLNVTFSKPLTQTLDSLKERSIHGQLVSPEFGGGTSNIEFEMLTGNSMYFFPTGTMAYKSYLNKNVDALPMLFNNQGYNTLGLHAYERWFWQRDKAYKYMGFKSFFSHESFDKPKVKGDFISDMTFSKEIIKKFEASKEPLFLFGVTMQNHGPYKESRYQDYDIKVRGPLNDKALGELRAYAQGIYDADKALKHLVDYFSHQEDETILVFFGDHLPMLGRSFSTFKQCGLIKSQNPLKWSREEKINMATTPFVIWSNKRNLCKDLGKVSPARIGLEVLKLAPIEKSSYFSWLDQVYDQYPVINKRIQSSVDSDILSRYKHLQMNMLFNK